MSTFTRHHLPHHLGLAGALLLAATASIVCTGATAADDDDPGIDSARAAIEKWVETRRIISKERRDWVLGKEILNERIELVKREIDSLREKIAEAEQNITTKDTERAELVAENDRLKEAASALSETVVGVEERTATLLQRLPDPIRDRVKPLSQRLPSDGAQTQLSLAERYQNVLGILNEINKFNREITVTSERRALPDGASAEVTAMYLGIGQGYYVGANGTIAGVGTAGPDGWVWTPANHAAQQIARAIAILKNEQVASFVTMPVNLE